MRKAPLVFLAMSAIASEGCAHPDPAHAAPIAASAYVRDGGCPESTRTDVIPLGSGFRVTGCGEGEAYYPCSNEHFDHTLHTSRLCCYRVKNADALRDALSVRTGEETCDE